MRTGIILNEPIGDYHAGDAVSSSKLCDLRPCARAYYEKHVAKTVPKKDGEHFDFGNAAHWLILEGAQALEERCVMQPETYMGPASDRKDAPMVAKKWNWNANACKEWASKCGGKLILTRADLDLAHKLAAAVAGNPDAAALVTGGTPEVTFRKALACFTVQTRADYWHPNGVTLPSGRIEGPVVVDLKSTRTIEHFAADYWKLRYYYRAAFYREVVREVLADMAGEPSDSLPFARFIFVAVEKESPNRCEVFEPTAADLETGRNEMLADLLTLRACYQSGEWPGARLGVLPIELKPWQRKLSADAGAALFGEEAA